MNAEELLIEESGEGQAVKRFHARIVHALRILYFTCQDKTRVWADSTRERDNAEVI